MVLTWSLQLEVFEKLFPQLSSFLCSAPARQWKVKACISARTQWTFVRWHIQGSVLSTAADTNTSKIDLSTMTYRIAVLTDIFITSYNLRPSAVLEVQRKSWGTWRRKKWSIFLCLLLAFQTVAVQWRHSSAASWSPANCLKASLA